jgi:hypothetical protein
MKSSLKVIYPKLKTILGNQLENKWDLKDREQGKMKRRRKN